MNTINACTRSVLGIALAALTMPAFASLFDDLDINFSGFLRLEGTYSTTSERNPYNQTGNIFNDQTVRRQTYAPPNLTQTQIDNLGLGGLINLGEVGTWNTVPLPLLVDNVRRGDFVETQSSDTNYSVIRAEAEMALQMGVNWRFVARGRALYDPRLYNEFDGRDMAGFQGGILGGDPRLYHGRPNYFEYRVSDGHGGYTNGNPLEFTGRDFSIDFPAFVLEYSKGPLTARVGNQQIAWGQAIFFRVLDVPNGLDLRRHSILDRGLEEFSDKRVPMLSARVTYQLPGSIIADAYVGRFQPQVFGNPNTGYNVIPSQFTVHDLFKAGGFDDELSYGMRMRADYGRWGWQAIAVRRMNPEGTFRWHETGVVRDLQQPVLGTAVNLLYALNPNPECGPTVGDALSRTPFEVAPAGVYSGDEWFTYAGMARLSGTGGLNAAINEFPCASALTASPVHTGDADFMAQGINELNTFFFASNGSLRGHIAREYHRENVFGLGLTYVTESEIDFLNQFIINLEASYQPNRHFTNITLSHDRLVDNEWSVVLVADKWHRFFNNFPGTYIVGQVLWKNKSDLVGRHLSGYGGSVDNGLPPGVNNATYLVFGFLQPLPNRIWDIEFASLYDPRGGLFMQPMVRWNPGRNIGVEVFYNFATGNLRGGGQVNQNSNLISTLGFADELALRLTWQF